MSSLGLRGLAASVLALLGVCAREASAQCSSWPGEPRPLPGLGEEDPILGGWSSRRKDELRGLALLLEGSDPVEAHRLWRHAACLAPGDTEIAAALARTAVGVVRRISVEAAPPAAAERRATIGAAFAALETSARIPIEPTRDPELERFDFDPIDAEIAAAEDHLQRARFHAAAQLADLSRARLARLPAVSVVSERRARIELLAATAHVALGNAEEARNCLERALAADPRLSLDEGSAPPKLLRLFDEARPPARAAP